MSVVAATSLAVVLGKAIIASIGAGALGYAGAEIAKAIIKRNKRNNTEMNKVETREERLLREMLERQELIGPLAGEERFKRNGGAIDWTDDGYWLNKTELEYSRLLDEANYNANRADIEEIINRYFPKPQENDKTEETPNTDAIVGDITTPMNPNINNNTQQGTGQDMIPNIQDKTEENITNEIDNQNDMMKWWEEWQAKLWEREDAIRKETQEREDNAYQRAVEDMRKAGINPNLININPAQSGGGITQASQMNVSALTEQMNVDLEKLQQMIDQAFESDENAKDRFTEVFGSLVSSIIMMAVMKG